MEQILTALRAAGVPPSKILGLAIAVVKYNRLAGYELISPAAAVAAAAALPPGAVTAEAIYDAVTAF